jgi:hypothetical protein
MFALFKEQEYALPVLVTERRKNLGHRFPFTGNGAPVISPHDFALNKQRKKQLKNISTILVVSTRKSSIILPGAQEQRAARRLPLNR